MYNVQQILPVLLPRIGFRQPTLEGYAILDADNQVSKSGRYFDAVHPQVTIQNIKDAVNIDNKIPDADFNTYLKNLKQDAILDVLSMLFNDQVDVVEQGLEYVAGTQAPQLILNQAGRFVGRQITVAPDYGLAVNIDSISLHFDGAATFNLYLYNSVNLDPVKTLEVTTEANNQTVVIPEDWVLNFTTGARKGGQFYIGYFQSDLGPVKAYDDQGAIWGCPHCYDSRSIDAPIVTGRDFVAGNLGLSSRTYGLGLEISVVRDYTQEIIKQSRVFDDAVGLQLAIKVVSGLMHNTRSNFVERVGENGAELTNRDLNQERASNEIPLSPGLKSKYNQAIKKLKEQFFGKPTAISATINDDLCCLPRHPRLG